MKFKISKEVLIGNPIHSSMFLTLYLLLLFLPLVRPPVILCAVFLTGLVYLSMFFGAKLAGDPSKN